MVGSTFWLGAVTSMGPAARGEVEATLRQLEQREFIRRERRSSVEGEVEYTFRHVLVRDAAYAQMPRAERAERHQRTAEWIASLGRADDHAELVAHHYLEAIQYAKAAGRDVAHLATAARAPLRDAGERALRLAAYPQAARYLGAALELMDSDDTERPEVMYRYGFARLSADSTGEEILAEAIDLLRSSGQPELAARAALLLTRFVWNRADSVAFDKWRTVVDELTAEFPDSVVRFEALVAQSGFYMIAGTMNAPSRPDGRSRARGRARPA